MPENTPMKPYRTVKERSECEIIIQKSKFIGRCFPMDDQAEALSELENVRKRHWDASHNCYAYSIGANGECARFSDDGEPGGTAGLPMMEVLKAKQLTNTLVIVTRYFGGILLGAGGLVRAYSKAASSAIAESGVIEMLPTRRFTLDMPYALWGKLENKFRGGELGRVMLDSPQFTDAVSLDILVRQSEEQRFSEAVTEASDGRIEAKAGEVLFQAWDDE